MILRRLFGEKRDGFYVDIGAHHPRRFSNTYHFYKRGWRGINIDAMPGSMKLFNRWRQRDINLEVAIGRSGQEARFFVLNDPAINSFDEELARSRATGFYHIVEEKQLRMRALSDVLLEYLPNGQHIDFLTVDVEGLDLDVLESNNWQLHRPTYVLAECWGTDIDEIRQNPIYRFLTEQGYEFVAKTVATLFFGVGKIGTL